MFCHLGCCTSVPSSMAILWAVVAKFLRFFVVVFCLGIFKKIKMKNFFIRQKSCYDITDDAMVKETKFFVVACVLLFFLRCLSTGVWLMSLCGVFLGCKLNNKLCQVKKKTKYFNYCCSIPHLYVGFIYVVYSFYKPFKMEKNV